MKKFQSGDEVIVIAGKHKGTKSTIISVREDKVLVKGVNVAKKAVKGQGFVEKTLPIHISNIAHYDPKAKSASKVGIKVDNGKKVRYYKKSGDTVLTK